MKYCRDKFPTSWEEQRVLVKKRKIKWFTEEELKGTLNFDLYKFEIIPIDD